MHEQCTGDASDFEKAQAHASCTSQRQTAAPVGGAAGAGAISPRPSRQGEQALHNDPKLGILVADFTPSAAPVVGAAAAAAAA